MSERNKCLLSLSFFSQKMSSDPHFFSVLQCIPFFPFPSLSKEERGISKTPKKSFSFTSSLCYSETPSYPFLSFSFYVAMHLYRFFREKEEGGQTVRQGVGSLG